MLSKMGLVPSYAGLSLVPRLRAMLSKMGLVQFSFPK